jgi:hypothetical protein
MFVRRVCTMLLAPLALGACVSNDPDDAEPTATTDAPPVSVTVPASRLTPFCQAMIDLTDRIASGAEPDVEGAIIATYTEVLPDVPPEIASDFSLVLAALESGAPPPTDPPPDPAPTTEAAAVTPSTPPDASSESGETDPVDATADEVSVDEGFDPSSSPADRVNAYVDFSCRNTGNNPGPPATEPFDVEASSDG